VTGVPRTAYAEPEIAVPAAPKPANATPIATPDDARGPMLDPAPDPILGRP
jgi:hypothetical protein